MYLILIMTVLAFPGLGHIAWRALAHRRMRHRIRACACANCGYSLGLLPTCPECGTVRRTEVAVDKPISSWIGGGFSFFIAVVSFAIAISFQQDYASIMSRELECTSADTVVTNWHTDECLQIISMNIAIASDFKEHGGPIAAIVKVQMPAVVYVRTMESGVGSDIEVKNQFNLWGIALSAAITSLDALTIGLIFRAFGSLLGK